MKKNINKIILLLTMGIVSMGLVFAQGTSISTTTSSTTPVLLQASTTTEIISPEKKATIALIKYTFDPTSPFPKEYLSVKKEIDEDIKTSKFYGEILFSSSKFVYDLESKVLDGKQGGKSVVKSVDARIKSLNTAKANMKKAEANVAKALKKLKNQSLRNEYSLVTVSNEQQMVDQLDVIHANIMEYLYNVKNFYSKISNNGANFAIIYGLSFSGDYNMSLEYFDYLEKSRVINKAVVSNLEKFMQLYSLNEDFIKKYLPQGEYSQIENSRKNLKETKDLLEQKVSTAVDLSSQSLNVELSRRLDTDARLVNMIEQMQELAQEAGPLMPTSSGSIVYTDKVKMNELATKYQLYNKLDKEYSVLEFQIKKKFFMENPRNFREHQKYDFLSDAEGQNLLKEIRDVLFTTVSVDLNAKLLDRLNKNFGKFKVAFDDPSIPYDYVFTNFKVNSEYTKSFDWFQKNFSVQIKESRQNN